MSEVAKRVAVVTGASSGIGAELARALAHDGWHCVLLARREERLRPLAEEIGGEFEVCDVSDRAAVDAVAARILERHPRVKLLVNNAGFTRRGTFLTGDPQAIEAVVRTNYLGGVWCLQAFLPGLEALRRRMVNRLGRRHHRRATVRPIRRVEACPARVLARPRRSFACVGSAYTIKPGYGETEGFPQGRLPAPLRRLVIGPDRIVAHVLGSLERGRGETTVPRYYAVAGAVQALFPNLVARLLARSAPRG